MGAVLTSHAIVQRFTGYEWLACSRVMDDQQVLHVARRLNALRLSLADLRKFYSNLHASNPISGFIHPRFCPSITSYRDEHGLIVKFKYAKPLERDATCVMYLAVREDTNEPIVVKFVRRYGLSAHRWMAGKGLAPNLICHSQLGDGYDNLAIVIMEYIDGQTLAGIYGTEPLPEDVVRGVHKALEVLGNGGFVFGDLRRPNVMISKGGGPAEERIRFIDFDWAGYEGQDLRYPFHLAEHITKCRGQDYGVIQREHQEKMLEELIHPTRV